jgi:cell cycle sensor histidine kinase DivJ
VRLSGTRTGDLLDAVAARCEGLVKSSVREPAARLSQRRLIGLALAAPFLVAAPAAILFPPLIGMPATLVAGAAIFGLPFAAVLLVALSGRSGFAGATLLFFGMLALAAIVAAAGGAASPAALVLAALPFESWWVRRTPRAALLGGAAALAAVPLQAFLATELGAVNVGPVAPHWLIPIAYMAFVLPRLAAWLDEKGQTQEASIRPLEEIVEAVVLRMDLAGEVTDASVQARRILGLAPELLLSSGLFDRLHVADRVAYLCALADLKEKQGFRRVEARVRVPGAAGSAASDFRAFVIEMMRPAIGDRTITMLLRTGDEPASLRASPAASADAAESRDLAKSRMLAAVSHELRTPLNSIIGFSDMLLHEMLGGFSDPRQKEYVGLVRESGNHLLSVVNSILDVSRLESGGYSTHPEPFRFGEAAEMCRSMLFQQATDKKLALTADVPSEVGEVRADKRAVKQMLINLVSNAIKFTPAGGEVAIGAKRIGSRLHFWVSDTGIGIPAEDLSRIGQPYVQVQNDYTRRFEGAGLGLSLVKGLVALHHGTMSIESEVGRGTTVTISLPVDQPAHETAADSAEILVMAANSSNEARDGTYRKTA